MVALAKKRSDRRGLRPLANHASLFPSRGAIFRRMKIWQLCISVIVGLGFAQLMAESPSPRRDINAVLAAHDRQLLDLPAVVGVLRSPTRCSCNAAVFSSSSDLNCPFCGTVGADTGLCGVANAGEL